jgi:glutaredoxin
MCRMAEDFLDRRNIRYEDVDVGKNEEAAREMIEKSGQMGVPVIEITGDDGKSKIVVGFDQNKLKKFLKIKS